MTSSSDLHSLLKRIEKATTRLEELSTKRSATKAPAGSQASGPADDAAADSKAAREYEAVVKPLVDHYIECSGKIGGVVGEQAQAVGQLYTAQRDFVRMAGDTKKPAAAQLPSLLGAQQQAIQAVVALKDGNRASEFFDNLSAVAEGIAAFGWVAVEPTPVPYINDMKESAEFYSNRVLKQWREKDPNQVEWVKAFLSILRELAAYVKQFHTTGVVWNPNGNDAESAALALKSEPATSGSAASAVPPPPPLPTAAQLEQLGAPSKAGGDESTRGALFADLNKGSDITSGLRKVDRDQMTHKNPSLRAAGSVKAGASDKPAQPPAGQPAARPKRMVLENDKWVVENYGTEHLTIEATRTKQTVYMYNCNGTTLDIKNKLTGIAIDSCQKCGVVFDTLVAQCEIVNCKSVQVQTRETVPSILIDRTDGAHVFLSAAARDQTQITTAKASEVNVSFPYETERPEDDNFVEQPVPEQFQTVVKAGKLLTTVLEHTG